MKIYFIILYIFLIIIAYYKDKDYYIPIVILFITYSIITPEDTGYTCYKKIKEILICLFLLLIFYMMIYFKCNEYFAFIVILLIISIFLI